MYFSVPPTKSPYRSALLPADDKGIVWRALKSSRSMPRHDWYSRRGRRRPNDEWNGSRLNTKEDHHACRAQNRETADDPKTPVSVRSTRRSPPVANFWLRLQCMILRLYLDDFGGDHTAWPRTPMAGSPTAGTRSPPVSPCQRLPCTRECYTFTLSQRPRELRPSAYGSHRGRLPRLTT